MPIHGGISSTDFDDGVRLSYYDVNTSSKNGAVMHNNNYDRSNNHIPDSLAVSNPSHLRNENKGYYMAASQASKDVVVDFSDPKNDIMVGFDRSLQADDRTR